MKGYYMGFPKDNLPPKKYWIARSNEEENLQISSPTSARHNSLNLVARTPYRSNSVRRSSKNNEPEEENRQETILSVAPLSSAPYIGPPLPQSNSTSLPTKVDDDGIEKVGPAMIFMPRTTRNEWDTAVAATKSGVVLTGTAALGKLGSAVGLVDIGESEDSYLFRVSLPGVARDEKDFSFDIEPDGSILIKGITMTGEKIVCMDSQVFEMQTQNLCPPGHFTVSFQLPGPVDHQQCSALFGNDGTFEGKVKKM